MHRLLTMKRLSVLFLCTFAVAVGLTFAWQGLVKAPEETPASPAELIRRTKFAKDRAALQALAAAQQVKGLVIGLPLNLDGSESPRSQSTRAFARNVEDMGLPILLWDERWSTQAVTRTLIEQDASRAKRAELVDKMAAAYILQGAIDALTRP